MQDDKLLNELIQKYQLLTPEHRVSLAIYVRTIRISRMIKQLIIICSSLFLFTLVMQIIYCCD